MGAWTEFGALRSEIDGILSVPLPKMGFKMIVFNQSLHDVTEVP